MIMQAPTFEKMAARKGKSTDGRWDQMGSDGISWHQMASDGIRWHQMASDHSSLRPRGAVSELLK